MQKFVNRTGRIWIVDIDNTTLRRVKALDADSEVAYLKTYRFTNCLKHWLADVPESPVLLHIDMDYFNNRFDGDSDWEISANSHDPSIEHIYASIDSLFAAITNSGLASKIEDVSVGISPRIFSC